MVSLTHHWAHHEHPGDLPGRLMLLDWPSPRVVGIIANTPWPLCGKHPAETMYQSACDFPRRQRGNPSPKEILTSLAHALEADLSAMRRAAGPYVFRGPRRPCAPWCSPRLEVRDARARRASPRSAWIGVAATLPRRFWAHRTLMRRPAPGVSASSISRRMPPDERVVLTVRRSTIECDRPPEVTGARERGHEG